ncbi:MAG TPA: threonine-phosphate decarboxylase CobD [Symbiobacteriaceae bacterium]|nr:threonine-phosphate decarboxylase CobD [Symbiobacteriaceae bacterium]
MIAPFAAPIHGGDVLAAAARWGLDPSAILDFSANINPLGAPPVALEAARAALASVTHYPEPHSRLLCMVLAERHGVPEGAILVGNGAAEVIHLLLRQAGGRRISFPVPGFAEYGRAARAVGGIIVAEGTPVPSGAGLQPGDFLILCNPHNPTGLLLTPDQVLAIADATAATVIVDEAFIDLTDAGEQGSVIPHVPQRANLVVIRSLTKFYALPGLRIGYAVGRPELVADLDRVRDPWSVSALAQAAALAALADHAYADRTREWVRAERTFLAGELARLPGYSIAPPSANFILLRAPEPAWAIQERLGPQGILIRDCRSFQGLSEYHVRVAVRSRPENLRLLEALKP